MEEEHDFFDLFLLCPGFDDLFAAFGADVLHFAQAFGVFVEDFEGFDAEMFNDAFCELGADAHDEAGAEIAADAFCGGGEGLFDVLGVELHAEFGVVGPFATEFDVFAGAEFGEVACHGNETLFVFSGQSFLIRFEAEDGVAVFFVIVCDAVYCAGEGLEFCHLGIIVESRYSIVVGCQLRLAAEGSIKVSGC